MKKIVLIVSCLFSLKAFSQKIFCVKINIPKAITLKNVEVIYDNGYESREVKLEKERYSFILSDTFFCRYAVVTVYDRQKFYNQQFFVKSKNGVIDFIEKDGESFVNNFVLKDVISIDEIGQKELYKTAGKEMDERDKFVRKYNDFSKENDSINKLDIKIEDRVRIKEYDFIKKNNKGYYSLWLFKYHFVNFGYYPAAKLFKFYTRYLKNNFKNYFEGEQIENILLGRINKLTGRVAPLFTSKSIEGDLIKLKDLRGKYILLNFWAPWCKPCVEEMPILNRIYQAYNAENIKIVSIDCDNDFDNFRKSIKKYDMNWINIFNDNDLINKYGKKKSLPQIYLIDQEGKIIYSREEAKDFDLKKLESFLSSQNFPNR